MLVLASASPRRQELLRNAGIPFNVQPASIPEIPKQGEAPLAFAKRMAQAKAGAIYRKFPEAFVLGADTVVTVDGLILGKPEDKKDAARMLRLLSGKQHEVITGVCLYGMNGASGGLFEDLHAETTSVTVNTLSDREIQDYVATGEPMDKAGAYAIQGKASLWISRIEGDYSNVVGLPIARVYRMLRDHGVI
jgi:nucleoside triphosphate pyrophosphatase